MCVCVYVYVCVCARARVHAGGGGRQRERENKLTSGTVSGFGGLEVSVLAFGTRVRGLKPGRSRRIFRVKKSSARLPSEGK